MNSFAAAALSCRILALYTIIGLLSNVAWLPLALLSVSHMGSYQTGNSGIGNGILDPSYVRLSTVLYSLLPFLLQIAFAAFLWIKAIWLARLMTVAVPDGESGPVTGGALQSILLTMIGIFVLVTAIPDAGRVIVTAVLAANGLGPHVENVERIVPDNWWLLLRFGLGFGLTFGASALSRRLDNLRSL